METQRKWDVWSWTGVLGQMVLAFGFLGGLLLFGFSQLAFGHHELGDLYRAPAQQNQPTRSTAGIQSVLEMQGEVSWERDAFHVTDSETGRVYRLTHVDSVKSLYDSGQRNFALTGTMKGVTADGYIFEVAGARAASETR